MSRRSREPVGAGPAVAAALAGLVLIGLLGGLAPLPAAAQAPAIAGAEIRTVAAGDDLSAAVAHALGSDVDWIGWRAPMLAGQRVCCSGHGGCCGTCDLEEGHGFGVRRDEGSGLARDDLLVVLRVRRGEVRAIRPYGASCRLAADGEAVAWLDGVEAAASVAWLESAARGREAAVGGGDLGEDAVTLLALHDGPEALDSLVGLARQADPEVRESAIFWLGSARGRAGYAVLDEIVGSDPSPELRERAVFALHVSDDPRATDRLIEVAHDDGSSEVRRQAVFWLAQEAGEVAADAIEDAAEHDPDRGVRLQAVFALSQLPPDEGVPLLIRLARRHRDPEVRKKALFWLGQTEDDRALDFIEELLRGGG